ncbi:hypothetical protein NYO98_10450 [Nocardioides sp. STR2]|uniref:Phage major tail protein, phi13 family n=1 Tax=Nocardioides pini TaxID=2975053 RepID=A0ABT4CCK2_9ACTN|nr:hypothetical protein [Nocardioides pini]MCY4726698.1 hypothetical protein [Nocardioides pini]
MSGNTENARLWADADVYVNPDVASATIPASITEAFAAAWGQVGLLNGEDGFTEAREEETGDHYAWGGILVRTSRRNFKLTKAFSALEDNATTRSLLWPGSTAGKLIVPRPVPVKVGFETRDGDIVRRLITARYAVITVNGDITENESDLTKYELLATIYPNAAGELFIEQKSDDATGA